MNQPVLQTKYIIPFLLISYVFEELHDKLPSLAIDSNIVNVLSLPGSNR